MYRAASEGERKGVKIFPPFECGGPASASAAWRHSVSLARGRSTTVTMDDSVDTSNAGRSDRRVVFRLLTVTLLNGSQG